MSGPQTPDESTVTECTPEPGQRCVLAVRRSCERSEDCEAQRDRSDSRERESDAGEVSEPTECRIQHRAEDRGPERRSDHLAAARARSGDGDPRECSGPGGGARDPLDEPSAAQCERAVGRGERKARHREEEKSSDDCSLWPESRGSEATRDATEKRACAVCADQKPGTRLRELELICVLRDERRQRREQRRVDEVIALTSRRRRRMRASVPAQKKYTEPVASSSDLPTDHRRSDNHSESHQPQTLRSRCIGDSMDRMVTGQAPFGRNSAQIAGMRPATLTDALTRSLTWS